MNVGAALSLHGIRAHSLICPNACRTASGWASPCSDFSRSAKVRAAVEGRNITANSISTIRCDDCDRGSQRVYSVFSQVLPPGNLDGGLSSLRS